MSDCITNGRGPQCPACGYVHLECEEVEEVVSYWGAEEDADFYCTSCGIKFRVREHVDRWWESTALVQSEVKDE